MTVHLLFQHQFTLEKNPTHVTTVENPSVTAHPLNIREFIPERAYKMVSVGKPSDRILALPNIRGFTLEKNHICVMIVGMTLAIYICNLCHRA